MGNLKKIKNYSSEILVFFAVMFKFLMLYIPNYRDNTVIIVYLVVLALALGLNFLLTKPAHVHWIKIIIYGGLVAIVTLIARDFNLGLIFLLALGFLNRNPRRFMVSLLSSLTLFFLLTIIFYYTGVITDPVFSTNNGEKIIESFGFGNPNTVFLFVFVIYLSLLFVFRPNYWWRIAVMVIAAILFYFTESRTGFFTLIIALILEITHLINYKSDYVKSFLIVSFLLCTVGTIVLAMYTGESANGYLNKLLSGRPHIIYTYIQNGDLVNLLGGKIIDSTVYPIDNLFLNFLIDNGIIVYSIYAYLYTYLMLKTVKSGNYVFITLMLSYFIFSLFEATLSGFAVAFPLVLFFISELSKERKSIDFGMHNYFDLKKGE